MPESAFLDEHAEKQMTMLMELIRGIRNRRAEYDVTPGKRIPALVAAGDAAEMLNEQRSLLCALAKLDEGQLTIAPTLEPPAQAATVIVGETTCYLPLAGLVDLEAERQRLVGELAETEGRIARSHTLLAGEFAQKAPAHVVQREREKLSSLQGERTALQERLTALG